MDPEIIDKWKDEIVWKHFFSHSNNITKPLLELYATRHNWTGNPRKSQFVAEFILENMSRFDRTWILKYADAYVCDKYMSLTNDNQPWNRLRMSTDPCWFIDKYIDKYGRPFAPLKWEQWFIDKHIHRYDIRHLSQIRNFPTDWWEIDNRRQSLEGGHTMYTWHRTVDIENYWRKFGINGGPAIDKLSPEFVRDHKLHDPSIASYYCIDLPTLKLLWPKIFRFVKALLRNKNLGKSFVRID